MTEFKTHKPSGRAAYPIVLLSGVEGGGKSWSAATATGLPGFHRSFWLEFGEQMAEEYGNVPGADYEIIEHNGSYRELLGAAQWAVAQSKAESAPSILVFDSATKLWEMLSDEQQIEANVRAAKKGRRTDGDANVTVDQWNAAKERFYAVLDCFRAFNGLVLVTARLDNNAVIGAGGTPTGERIWKIRAQKDLPFDCQIIMQARQPRQWTLTKANSSRFEMPSAGFMDWPDFTIEELLIRLELDPAAAPVERSYARPDAADAVTGGAQAQQETEQGQDHSAEPRGDVPPLPSDLDAQIKALEKDLDKAALLRLYNLAKAHNNRIAAAKVESAGKRVARRIEAGETPPEAQQAEENPPKSDGPSDEELAQEAELQRLAEEAEAAADPKADTSPSEASEDSSAAPESQPTPEPKSNDGSATTASSDSQVDDTATNTAPDTTNTPEPETAAPEADKPPFEPDPTEECPFGRNVWSGQPVADPALRQETPRRKGTVAALTEVCGDLAAADDQVFGMVGLSIVEASTKTLAEVLAYVKNGATK